MPDYKALYLDLLKDVTELIENLQKSQDKSLRNFIEDTGFQAIDEKKILIYSET